MASASKVEICHQCDGAGGFTWDMGEQGGVLKWLKMAIAKGMKTAINGLPLDIVSFSCLDRLYGVKY